MLPVIASKIALRASKRSLLVNSRGPELDSNQRTLVPLVWRRRQVSQLLAVRLTEAENCFESSLAPFLIPADPLDREVVCWILNFFLTRNSRE